MRGFPLQNASLRADGQLSQSQDMFWHDFSQVQLAWAAAEGMGGGEGGAQPRAEDTLWAPLYMDRLGGR